MRRRVTDDSYAQAELTDRPEALIDLELNRDFTDLVLVACRLLEEQSRRLLEIALRDSDTQLDAIRARRVVGKLERMIREAAPEVDRRDVEGLEVDPRIRLGSWVRHIPTGEEWRVDDLSDVEYLRVCRWLHDG